MIAIEENISLRPFNTFGLPVTARIFSEATNLSDLQTLTSVFRSNPLPKLILGGGSNLLFTHDFEGIVIYPNLKGIGIVSQNDEFVWVKAFAGENWDAFVAHCVSKNWGGIENLSLIPGNVGASPIQNIGAYGVEAKDSIDSVDVLDLENGSVQTLSNEACKFGYRNSIFKQEAKNKFIVIAVMFKLQKQPNPKITYRDVAEEISGYPSVTVQTIRQAIVAIRERKLPNPQKIGNAGSFFKNPVISDSLFHSIKDNFPTVSAYPADNGMHKIAAAWLIQQCGWKGKREGDVGTFEHQPLVLVNYGNAQGSDIIAFAGKIRQSVFDTFRIELEMEVNII